MGEQFIDLFAAGAYGLAGRLSDALSGPSMGWFFYLLAAAGILVAILRSALEGTPALWIRHLAVVAIASVLIARPYRFELADLTYAAPGRVEAAVGTRVGAAPHLTYAIERVGATIHERIRRLLHAGPQLAVPAVAAQVADLASDPAMLADPQLKANLQIWRDQVAPRILQLNPELQARLRDRGLLPDLLNPAPPEARWIGPQAAQRAAAVRAELASSGIDLARVVADLDPLQKDVADAAGAQPWSADASGAFVLVRFASRTPPTPDPVASALTAPDYADALVRGTALSQSMTAALPAATTTTQVGRADQLHALLGRSLLYAAAASYLSDDTRLATIGSLCQRQGDEACAQAQAPLVHASQSLRVPAPDAYNSTGWITLFKQPLATALLLVASLLLDTLSSIVVAVLPFLLGAAKALAIVMSVIGAWMLLWPGRVREAIGWMVLPIAFVSVWAILFGLWTEVETFLGAIASAVGHSEHGSFSAGRIMSIAISLGYLGLPVFAAGVLSGNAWRALDHANGHLERALVTAWRTRHTMISFGRRWLTNSPLARRWNQRAYRAVGLGALPRPKRAPKAPGPRGTPSAPAGRRPAAPARRPSPPAPGQVPLDLGPPKPGR